jgi:hypothetical protein
VIEKIYGPWFALSDRLCGVYKFEVWYTKDCYIPVCVILQVVLSACSTYFDAIFSQYEENNPIVILKDVKFTDIKALVEFMYKGEINIDHVSEIYFSGTYYNLNYIIF